MYITINVFVMQAFMFLSGYFSKKPDRAQETAFSTFMWPYLVFTVLYYFIRIFFFGSANLKLLTPPFALWFLLKQSVHNYHMAWWEDTLLRILVWLLASGWIIFCINVIPSKKNFISFIGMNTMPIYVFHLTLRYVIDFYGLYMGFISCLVVAWFAIISLIHRKVKAGAENARSCDIVYGIAIAASIAVFFLMFNSGCLTSLYGLCPENKLAFYFMVYGGALICGVSFVAPFWIKLYDLLIGGPVKGSKLAKWLQGPAKPEAK